MLRHCQNNVPPDPARARSWPDEPSLVEMLGDPVFQQLMASDRVSMESLADLVSSVRQRLAR